MANHSGIWSVERVHEKTTGFRAISIRDGEGMFVANMVMQLKDNELEIARFIVDAVNEKLKRESLP